MNPKPAIKNIKAKKTPESFGIDNLDINDAKAVRKKIIQLAGPSLTEMMLTNFVLMLNMIMVGRIGSIAVTAVGLTNQPLFLALAAFMALNVGTTAIVARSIGAGNYEEANRAAGQAFTLNVLLAIVLTFLCYIFTKPILVLMGAEEEVLKEGVLYAQIVFLSLGFTTISMGLSAVLRGAGDTRTPMKINVLSNILVVAIGFPLIYGFFGMPEMGVVGAAIATAFARLMAAIWVVYVTFSGKFSIKLTLKNILVIDIPLIRRIVNIGLPSAGEQFAMRGGQLIFIKMVASLGTVTFAATQIAFNILGLTFMPGMAFALVATTLVGQALGAGDPDLAEKFGWETRKIGMFVAGSIGLLFIAFAPYIMMPYTNEQEVIRQGAIALRIIGFVQMLQATQFILAGALRGAGDTKFPLYSTFIGVWGFRVLLCLLFVIVLKWGILGAWLAIAIDQTIRSLLIYLRYKSGKWKLIKI